MNEDNNTDDRTIEVTVDEAFAIVPLWVVRHPDLSDRAVRLYGTLGGYADNQTHRCWPSRARLAADLHCSLNSIDRAARELLDAGAVTVQHRFDDNGNRMPNLWTLHRINRGAGRTGAATPTPTGGATLPPRVGHRTRSNELDTHTADAVVPAPTQPTRTDRLTAHRTALLQAFGVDPATIAGKRGWGPWNAAARDLADAGVEPSEIPARLQQLRARDRWRDRITPIVLVQEWATLVSEDAPPARLPDPAAATRHVATFARPDDLPDEVQAMLTSAGFTHPDELAAGLTAHSQLTPTN